jgi:hypothetical protein
MLFNPLFFLAGLTVGIFLVCSLSPEQKIVVKYPTPENGGTVYKDGNGVCYKYNSAEVKCDGQAVKDYPIQSS